MVLSTAEQKRAARTQKARNFFVFLRTRRHALLDADFQQTLAQSYRPEPGGKAPVDAGVLALATLWPFTDIVTLCEALTTAHVLTKEETAKAVKYTLNGMHP